MHLGVSKIFCAGGLNLVKGLVPSYIQVYRIILSNSSPNQGYSHLCFHSESLSSGCAGENSSNIEPVGLVDLVLHVEGGGGQEEQEEGGGEWQGEQEGGGQGCQIGAGWKHFGRL